MNNVRSDTLQDYHERLNRVLLFIDQHRSEPLSVDRLAAIACLSPFHFHRIFRALVGESVGQYVQRIRLDSAVLPLQTSKRSILEIALDAGYESAAAFSRAFEQRFGMAPTECRTSHRLEIQVRAAKLKESNTDAMITPDIRQRPDTRVIFIRNFGPYASTGQAWEQVCGFACKNNLFGPNTALIGISLDDPKITAEEQIRYDACVTIEREIQPEGKVGTQTIPGGRYAVFLHQGAYETLMGTYDAIFRDWLPSSGERLRDQPAFELYLNTPDKTAPADLRTEIWVPLERR